MPQNNESKATDEVSELDVVRDRLNKLEADLIRQDHRVVHTAVRFWNRKSEFPDPSDKRRTAVVWAFMSTLFFSPTAIAAGGGLIGLVSIILFAHQNSLIVESNELIRMEIAPERSLFFDINPFIQISDICKSAYDSESESNIDLELCQLDVVGYAAGGQPFVITDWEAQLQCIDEPTKTSPGDRYRFRRGSLAKSERELLFRAFEVFGTRLGGKKDREGELLPLINSELDLLEISLKANPIFGNSDPLNASMVLSQNSIAGESLTFWNITYGGSGGHGSPELGVRSRFRLCLTARAVDGRGETWQAAANFPLIVKHSDAYRKLEPGSEEYSSEKHVNARREFEATGSVRLKRYSVGSDGGLFFLERDLEAISISEDPAPVRIHFTRSSGL